jgi:hypothetical protein
MWTLFIRKRPATIAYALAIPLWAVLVVGGFAWLSAYKATPGAISGAPPSRWPSESRIERDPARATLVLFAHPHCPCTRASVSELARLAARLGERVSVRVLFLRPREVPRGWETTDLWRTVESIPRAVALRDEGGLEAARFGAATSGFTVLYDAEGRLLFRGGLTASRGHEGDSFGQRRIVSLVTTGSADRDDSPVFGCAFGPHASGPRARRSDAGK